MSTKLPFPAELDEVLDRLADDGAEAPFYWVIVDSEHAHLGEAPQAGRVGDRDGPMVDRDELVLLKPTQRAVHVKSREAYAVPDLLQRERQGEARLRAAPAGPNSGE